MGAYTLWERTGDHHPPHLALMVGDRPEDEQCAQAAGVDFLDAAEWLARATTEADHAC